MIPRLFLLFPRGHIVTDWVHRDRQGGIGLSSVALAGAAGCEVRVVICADCWEVRGVGGSKMELGTVREAGRGRRKGSDSLVLLPEGMDRGIVKEVRAYRGGERLVGRK